MTREPVIDVGISARSVPRLILFVADDQVFYAINYDKTTQIESKLCTVLHILTNNRLEQRNSTRHHHRKAIRIQDPTYYPAPRPKY